jgi:hypothetical protein
MRTPKRISSMPFPTATRMPFTTKSAYYDTWFQSNCIEEDSPVPTVSASGCSTIALLCYVILCDSHFVVGIIIVLAKYELYEFVPLVDGMRKGDLRTFNDALVEFQDRFIR